MTSIPITFSIKPPHKPKHSNAAEPLVPARKAHRGLRGSESLAEQAKRRWISLIGKPSAELTDRFESCLRHTTNRLAFLGQIFQEGIVLGLGF
jgi:hypothetical protein